jgi:hypothetical protein
MYLVSTLPALEVVTISKCRIRLTTFATTTMNLEINRIFMKRRYLLTATGVAALAGCANSGDENEDHG